MVRLTDTTAECFFKGRRVAAHVRSYLRRADIRRCPSICRVRIAST